VKRLLLVRHAATSATRAAAFPADEPIEPGAEALAAALGGLVPHGRDVSHEGDVSHGRDGGDPREAAGEDRDGAGDQRGADRRSRVAEILAGPALRCAQTAAAAELSPRVEPLIAECDFGAWAGRSLAEVHEDDPAAVASWMGDAAAAPHGGESLAAFAARVGGWLDAQAASDGTTLAITHGGVVKAALVHALGAPLDAFWRLDVAPLTVTELHAHDGRWTISRTNCPLELAGRRPGVAATEPARGAATPAAPEVRR
jgi:broad specificity phosphatase PhoE